MPTVAFLVNYLVCFVAKRVPSTAELCSIQNAST